MNHSVGNFAFVFLLLLGFSDWKMAILPEQKIASGKKSKKEKKNAAGQVKSPILKKTESK